MSNLVRSLFVSALPAIALYFACESIWQMFHYGWSWTLIGRLITAITVAGFFAKVFLVSTARTSEHLSLYTIVAAIGVIINSVGSFLIDDLSYTSIIASVILFVLWIMYVRWYSVFVDRDKETIKVGKQLLDFKLINTKGDDIKATDLFDKPTIWMFYRGNWCPLCMAQIKEIAADYKAIEEKGAQVALISPQPHHFTKGLAKKHDVNFNFLTDPKATAAKQLGIYAQHGTPTAMVPLGFESDTVLPTVIITDKGGEIVYADLTDNYRMRPEPSEFIKVLDEIAA